MRMWAGHAEGVAAYGLAVCDEWVTRGWADTCAATIGTDLSAAGPPPPRIQSELAARDRLPEWLGDDRVHRSHRAALVRKDPDFYAERFPEADPSEPYFWPV